MRHGGSVMAPDATLAVHYAREMYGRRQESVHLWVVRRADIHDLADPDLLQPPLDRSFKKPGGYVMREKLAAARELSGTCEAQGEGQVTLDGVEPLAMDFGGGSGLDGRERALALLLLSMADDEFVIGFSDSEWTGIGPILEEDVAISSLAQDELGHAQALYRLFVEVVADGRDEDAVAYDRPPEGYFHARLLDHGRGDWAMTIARRWLYETADAARLAALAESSHEPLRQLVAKLRREERYHQMHVDAWLDRLAAGGAEPRRRLEAALAELGPDAGTVLAPLPGEVALVRHGILSRAVRGDRGRLARDHEHASRGAGSAGLAGDRRPEVCTNPPLRGVPVAPRGVHDGPSLRGRGDVVTAAQTVAPGIVPSPAPIEAAVRGALQRVHDPEIPTVSIVDLGLVHDVRVEPDRIAVELLPTFVACPALEVIRGAVADALADLGRPVDVSFTFAVPWTTDRLNAAGRAGLRAAGIAPPADPADVHCPYCESARVAMDSSFGPTLCRSIFYCRDCRQPFEAFKPI